MRRLAAMRIIQAGWVLWLACGVIDVALKSETVAIAAASDLQFALEEMVPLFKREHPEVKVRVTYGSSGNFYAQLSQRAPFDVFLSADMAYPMKLIEAGKGVAGSQFSYGAGRIVVWGRTNAPVNPAELGVTALPDERVRRIAIAQPEHAPYGKAAVAALRKLGVYEEVKGKLVYGENIAQTAQFVESGAADVGIIALSLAVAPALKSKGRYWEVPLEAYPRLEQGGVILPWTKNEKAAKEFCAFMQGEAGKAVLRRFGFFLPE